MASMRQLYRIIVKNICLFAILYCTARAAMILGAPVHYIALVWLPTGLALAAVVLWGYAMAPAVFLAGLCVQQGNDIPLATAVGVAVANTVEAALGAWLLKYFRVRPSLSRVRDVLVLVVAVALGSTLVSAILGMGSLWLGGEAGRHDVLRRGVSWWLVDAASDLIVAPAILVWASARPRWVTKRQPLEVVLFLVVTAAACALIFSDDLLHLGSGVLIFKPHLFAPLLVWAALRFGQYGTTGVVLLAAGLGAFVALTGAGPLADVGAVNNLMYLEMLSSIAAIAMMVLAASIDEQTRMAHCLRQREVQLRRAKQAADAANLAKSAFLANVSHEIRTPLGAMLGFTDFLLEAEQSPAECRGHAMTIKRNGELLARIIDDILDLSKVEADRLDIETLRFSLADLLSDVTALMAFKAQEKGLALTVVSDGLIPRMVTSDPTRLRQILLNVIGNAIKFTARGSVNVRLKMADSVCLKSGFRHLEVVISDTGTGLSGAQAQRLFQPFSQGDNSMTRRFGGTGLGLFLSQKLARALSGDLRLATTAPDKGSAFVLTLPLAPADCLDLYARCGRQTEVCPASKDPVTVTTPLKNVKILLVEDSQDNQILISRILRFAGCDLDVVDNGIDGICKAEETWHDVVLMDIQMPGVDGYAAMTTLRQHGYVGPIIALTAHAMKNERERALREGFDDYLTKPVLRDVMIATIGRWAQRAKPGLHGSH